MLEDTEVTEILKSISLGGTANRENARVKHIFGENLAHILNLASGSIRFHSNIISRFKLILGQPRVIEELNSFEIRCSLCKKVISYPCWYYSLKAAINHFHYFVCFDDNSNLKPSVRCYRKGV